MIAVGERTLDRWTSGIVTMPSGIFWSGTMSNETARSLVQTAFHSGVEQSPKCKLVAGCRVMPVIEMSAEIPDENEAAGAVVEPLGAVGPVIAGVVPVHPLAAKTRAAIDRKSHVASRTDAASHL
jgi:hypothetical protein